MKRGTKNLLDSHCHEHDINYFSFNHDKSRNFANQELATETFQLFKSKDDSIDENVADLGVVGAKTALEIGLKNMVTKPRNKITFKK